MQTLMVKTREHSELVDITGDVQRLVDAARIERGYAVLYVPHTTAGITINENADPTVKSDMLQQLDEMVPWRQPFYRHAEGNSAAHVKASMVGFSSQVLIEDKRLVLGTWQGIYFCEFDGPRSRKLHVCLVACPQ